MIDRNILINLHRIFVFVREDIKSEETYLILNLILNIIIDLGDNEKLIKAINENYLLQCKYLNSLITGNNYIYTDYNIEFIKHILISTVNEIIDLRNKKKYDEAMALVDAIHVFPEIEFNKRKELIDYWDCYINPFIELWHNNCFEQYKEYFYV